MIKRVFREIEDFELHHKILFFIAVMFITITVVRVVVLFLDADIIVKGFELHHFYYGVVLLIITSLAMLFGKMHMRIYLILTAISIGLVADEILYVMGNMQEKSQYYSTLPSAIIFSVILIAIVFFVHKKTSSKISQRK